MNVNVWFYKMEQAASGSMGDPGPSSAADEALRLVFVVCQQQKTVSSADFACLTVPSTAQAWLMCFVPAAVSSGLTLAGACMFVESLGAGEESLLVSSSLVPVENGHVAIPVLNVRCIDVNIIPQMQLESVLVLDVMSCDTTPFVFERAAPQQEQILICEQSFQV